MSQPKAGRQLMASLKQMAGSPYEMVLPVGKPVDMLLRPVATVRERLNPADVTALTKWRNDSVTSFLTEFVATESSTADWLCNVVGPDEGKILFMVDDLNGNTFGYVGLAFINWDAMTGEADAIVRGGKCSPFAMARAMATMMEWARETLEVKRLGGRVRSDNPALPFFWRSGFVEVKRMPLLRSESPGMVRYAEEGDGKPSPVSLVHIRWQGRA
jgi:perosamine synthetase